MVSYAVTPLRTPTLKLSCYPEIPESFDLLKQSRKAEIVVVLAVMSEKY